MGAPVFKMPSRIEITFSTTTVRAPVWDQYSNSRSTAPVFKTSSAYGEMSLMLTKLRRAAVHFFRSPRNNLLYSATYKCWAVESMGLLLVSRLHPHSSERN